MGEPESNQLDCQHLSPASIREYLNALVAGSEVKLTNLLNSPSGFGSGVTAEAAVEVDGHVGDFAFLLNHQTDWIVAGKAGDACGHSMCGSSILVRESAGHYAGAFATGGLLVVHGQAGRRCGFAMRGGDVLVRSTVGDEAGLEMHDGILALANGAGERLGSGMRGGTIYVRGTVKSFVSSVRKFRMKDADCMRLSLLLARAGVRGDAKEFSAYRFKGKS